MLVGSGVLVKVFVGEGTDVSVATSARATEVSVARATSVGTIVSVNVGVGDDVVTDQGGATTRS